MKFSTDRWHLIAYYYLASLEQFLSIHDDLTNNRVYSASSSLRVLLELVCKGLVIVHCTDHKSLEPKRIAKLWKRQVFDAKKNKFIERNASINRLLQELTTEIPALEILHRLLKQVTPSEKATFIEKLHHAVHGEVEGLQLWVRQGMNSESVRNELEWLSLSLVQFFKVGAEFDFWNDLSLDAELKTAILNRYEEMARALSLSGFESLFFAEELKTF
jgi:hypothetical protein